MFETAELERSIPNRTFKKESRVLRKSLLDLQLGLRELGKSQVVIVFAGVDGGGKGDLVNVFNGWMDARWLVTRAFDDPSEEESERPEFFRFWRSLPQRGQIGMYLSSWYSRPLLDHVYEVCDDACLDRILDRILSFEKTLSDDGALILKFWMHLGFEAQKKRLDSRKEDPLIAARVTEKDWKNWSMYQRFVATAERMIKRTNTGHAPWSIVEGTDANYRSLAVGSMLRDALSRRLEEMETQQRITKEINKQETAKKSSNGKKGSNNKKSNGKSTPDSFENGVVAGQSLPTVLNQLDMDQALDKPAYEANLAQWQARLHELHLKARAAGIATVLVFEGPDAAGKGGAIRRITSALLARNYQVHGIAAPTQEELAQHYLWRFWQRLPRAGRTAIFDRSWYGRVLVERIQGLATDEEWRRAYGEINDFEEQLIEHGTVLVKFWLHITEDEQLRRFEARDKAPYKRWKLTAEDWRNRDRWSEYEQAVNDLVELTSTGESPWVLVEGNNKRFARIKTLQTVVERLELAIERHDELA